MAAYNFHGELYSKMTGRCDEFVLGLDRYLAIKDVRAIVQGGAFSDNFAVSGGTLDDAHAASIRLKFSTRGLGGIVQWERIRNEVFALLTTGDSDIDVHEASDQEAKDNSRVGWAKHSSRNLYFNIRDMTRYTIEVGPAGKTTQEAVARSFDGFWLILHESIHVSEADKAFDFGGNDESPGVVESDLNLIRGAFGLPLRTNYANDTVFKKKRPGTEFEGGGKVFWP
jgi:hypothetical protein